MTRPLWQRLAACAGMGPDAFFPDNHFRTPEICQTCPVQHACLEYALENNIAHGVWGGKSERARMKIRESRRHAAS